MTERGVIGGRRNRGRVAAQSSKKGGIITDLVRRYSTTNNVTHTKHERKRPHTPLSLFFFFFFENTYTRDTLASFSVVFFFSIVTYFTIFSSRTLSHSHKLLNLDQKKMNE